jgi:FtsP/CotA-like multicopper oxidase with cupredoxin domain
VGYLDCSAGSKTGVVRGEERPKKQEKASPGKEFRYVWHCHILEHEDNEMMRPYKIIG